MLNNNTQHHEEGWTLVEKRRRSIHGVKKLSTRITGSKQTKNDIGLKASNRTVDIFIGRIDVSNTIDDLKMYIKDNFRINIIDISQITARYNHYNCYKVQILLNDRDCLFNANMWPEGVIINKFYNRKN